MSKMKTVDTFIEKCDNKIFYEEMFSSKSTAIDIEDVKKLMIEYAKHILEVAAEEVTIDGYVEWGHGDFKIDKDSILKLKEQLK